MDSDITKRCSQSGRRQHVQITVYPDADVSEPDTDSDTDLYQLNEDNSDGDISSESSDDEADVPSASTSSKSIRPENKKISSGGKRHQ